MIAHGEAGVLRGNHLAHGSRAHYVANAHRRDIRLAFIHPAAHRGIQ
jgi:hypothetical protein